MSQKLARAISMEMQGMAAPRPTPRNSLEADYYAQLQDPNSSASWLAKLFG